MGDDQRSELKSVFAFHFASSITSRMETKDDGDTYK